jgi:2'-5' RNA ligase
VPEAEGAVHAWRARLDPSAVRGVPAHVTVLYPFMPADDIDDRVVARLRACFASCAPFRYTVTAVEWFGDDVVYLSVAPPEPFVALTEAVVAAYPDYPPYSGAHDTLVPHLTVGMSDDPAAMQAAARAVAPSLPIGATAEEVWLMTGGTRVHTWRVHTRFALGSDQSV